MEEKKPTNREKEIKGNYENTGSIKNSSYSKMLFRSEDSMQIMINEKQDEAPLHFSNIPAYSSHPPVSVFTGTEHTGSTGEYEEELKKDIEYYPNKIVPISPLNRLVIGEVLPGRELIRLRDPLEKFIPSFCTPSSSEWRFDFITELNATNLLMNKSYFLKQEKDLDTALNQEGLETLMKHYPTENARAFNKQDFIQYINNDPLYPSACLVHLQDYSERHVTGFFFKENENNQKSVYVFDSIGLTFPAYPCAYRYPNTDFAEIRAILEALSDKGVLIYIMPINTVLPIQKDKYSCLMATLFFFSAMQKGQYRCLEEPGITTTWGDSAIFNKNNPNLSISRNIFSVRLYTLSSFLILAGCQNSLAFLFMIDPLEMETSQLEQIIKFRTDWSLPGPAGKDTNVFFQFSYVQLLKWLDACIKNEESLHLPDFEALLRSDPQKRINEKSPFEDKFKRLYSFSESCELLIPTKDVELQNILPKIHNPIDSNIENDPKDIIIESCPEVPVPVKSDQEISSSINGYNENGMFGNGNSKNNSNPNINERGVSISTQN